MKDWPSENPPRPLPARDVKFPPYEIRTLANGMRVVVVMHHEQPVVTLRLLVQAGSVCDSPRKSGVAALAAALLDQGTTTRSAEQIADTIDSIGGGLGTGAGSDLSFANVIVMKDSLALGFDLLSDVVRNPAFQQEEIDRQRQQAVSGLRVSFEDPDYVASVVFDRLVYGFHPYGLPGSGTPESLQSITAADLHAFHGFLHAEQRHSRRRRRRGGRRGVCRRRARVRQLGPKRDVPPVQAAEPPVPTRRLVIVNKPDAVQTEIRVGHLGIARQHKDYLAVDLAMKILGGEGSNRLHRVLRSERGLTYGAEASMQSLKQGGDFMAETDTRTDTTAEVLRLIVDEFQKLQRERVRRARAGRCAGVPGRQLSAHDRDARCDRRAGVERALLRSAARRDRELSRAGQRDHGRRHPARRAAVPPARSAVGRPRRRMRRRSSTQLKGVGFTTFEVVNLSDLDLTAADFRRAARRRRQHAAGARTRCRQE